MNRISQVETMPKNSFWVLGWAVPQTPIPLYPTGQKRWFCVPRMGMFELHNAKKYIFGFWGGAPNTHTSVRTSWARKSVFGYRGWGCLKWTMPNILFGLWCGAPNTHNSAHHRPEEVFLDTWDGGVWNGQCQKILFVFWCGAPNTHTIVRHRPAHVFLDTWVRGV